MRPNGQLNVVGDQIAQQAMQTALLLKGVKDEAHDPPRLLIWIELGIAVGTPHIAQRGMIEQRSSPCLVPHAFYQATLHEVEFRFAHHATQP